MQLSPAAVKPKSSTGREPKETVAGPAISEKRRVTEQETSHRTWSADDN
jgi:hypothetical protein